MNNIMMFFDWKATNISVTNANDPAKIRVSFKGVAPEPEKTKDGEPSIWNTNYFTAFGREAQVIAQYIKEGDRIAVIEAEQHKYCKYEKNAAGAPMLDANGNAVRTFKDSYTIRSLKFGYNRQGNTDAMQRPQAPEAVQATQQTQRYAQPTQQAYSQPAPQQAQRYVAQPAQPAQQYVQPAQPAYSQPVPQQVQQPAQPAPQYAQQPAPAQQGYEQQAPQPTYSSYDSLMSEFM